MTDIQSWLPQFLDAVNTTFQDRVWFVGLQGSYARGEATTHSDIDAVVILDTLSAPDIQVYGAMLDTLSNRELICGFLSGKQELLNWEPSDLFQFYYDTKPLQGSLDSLLPLLDDGAVAKAIKSGVCNIYHGCVHNMLYDRSDEILKALYKAASFVVQAIAFRQTGYYTSRLTDLQMVVAPAEQAIITAFLAMKQEQPSDFDAKSAALLQWSQQWINR